MVRNSERGNKLMQWLISTSLHLRIAVVALSIILMIVGIRVVHEAPLDVFPEFAPPLSKSRQKAPVSPPRRWKT